MVSRSLWFAYCGRFPAARPSVAIGLLPIEQQVPKGLFKRLARLAGGCRYVLAQGLQKVAHVRKLRLGMRGYNGNIRSCCSLELFGKAVSGGRQLEVNRPSVIFTPLSDYETPSDKLVHDSGHRVFLDPQKVGDIRTDDFVAGKTRVAQNKQNEVLSMGEPVFLQRAAEALLDDVQTLFGKKVETLRIQVGFQAFVFHVWGFTLNEPSAGCQVARLRLTLPGGSVYNGGLI